MDAEVEAFHLHLVTTTYGEALSSAGRAECLAKGLTTTRVIWREFRKVRMESETAYGLGDNVVIISQYLWGTLKAHRVMDDFLRVHLRQYTEMALHITLYLFEQRSSMVEVEALKNKVEFQSKTITQIDKNLKELRSTVDLLTGKATALGRNRMRAFK